VPGNITKHMVISYRSDLSDFWLIFSLLSITGSCWHERREGWKGRCHFYTLHHTSAF